MDRPKVNELMQPGSAIVLLVWYSLLQLCNDWVSDLFLAEVFQAEVFSAGAMQLT
jgi:hypothetical protein